MAKYQEDEEETFDYWAWRAEIEAQIAALQMELYNLNAVIMYANDAKSAIGCLSSKLTASSDLFKQAGTIGGIPLDRGKASERATQLNKIKLDIQKIPDGLAPRIAEIQAEIDRLSSML